MTMCAEHKNKHQTNQQAHIPTWPLCCLEKTMIIHGYGSILDVMNITNYWYLGWWPRQNKHPHATSRSHKAEGACWSLMLLIQNRNHVLVSNAHISISEFQMGEDWLVLFSIRFGSLIDLAMFQPFHAIPIFYLTNIFCIPAMYNLFSSNLSRQWQGSCSSHWQHGRDSRWCWRQTLWRASWLVQPPGWLVAGYGTT